MNNISNNQAYTYLQTEATDLLQKRLRERGFMPHRALLEHADLLFNLKDDPNFELRIPEAVKWQLLYVAESSPMSINTNFVFDHLQPKNLALLYRILNSYSKTDHADNVIHTYVNFMESYLGGKCTSESFDADDWINALKDQADPNLNDLISSLEKSAKKNIVDGLQTILKNRFPNNTLDIHGTFDYSDLNLDRKVELFTLLVDQQLAKTSHEVEQLVKDMEQNFIDIYRLDSDAAGTQLYKLLNTNVVPWVDISESDVKSNNFYIRLLSRIGMSGRFKDAVLKDEILKKNCKNVERFINNNKDCFDDNVNNLRLEVIMAGPEILQIILKFIGKNDIEIIQGMFRAAVFNRAYECMKIVYEWNEEAAQKVLNESGIGLLNISMSNPETSDFNIAQFILHKGVSPLAKIRMHAISPIQKAFQIGSLRSLSLYFKYCDKDKALSDFGKEGLIEACKSQNMEMIEFLLEQNIKIDDYAPIIKAAIATKHTGVLKILEQRGKIDWIQKITSVGQKYGLDKHIKTVESDEIDHEMIVKEMLGISGDMDPKELKSRFKKIFKEVHPDQAPEDLKESARLAQKYVTFLFDKFK